MWQCAYSTDPGSWRSRRMSTAAVCTSTVSFHTRFGSSTPSRAQHEPAPRTMYMERVRHRMVGVHLVDESDLDLISNPELPVGAFAAPVSRSMSSTRVFPAVVRRFTSTMSSSHSIPSSVFVSVIRVTVALVLGMSRVVVVMLVWGRSHVVPRVLVGVDKMCWNELHATLRGTDRRESLVTCGCMGQDVAR